MLLYNNDERFGDCGPFEVASVDELVGELAESIRTWAHEEWEADVTEGPGVAFIPERTEYEAVARERIADEFRAALSVVCPRCGEHGPAGDLDWVCGC
ncbi:MAG: hypothetical protein WC683_02050 [bacterium]